MRPMKASVFKLFAAALMAVISVSALAQNAQPSESLEFLFDPSQISVDYSSVSAYKFNYPSVDETGSPIVLSSALFVWHPRHESLQTGDAIESVHIECHYTMYANADVPSNQTTANAELTLKLQRAQGEYPNTHQAYGNYNDILTRSIIISPDYEGYGVSSNRTHPYMNQKLTARQVVDAVQYGLMLYQRLVDDPDTDFLPLSHNWRCFSYGASQGGSVAMAVQRYIEENNLSDELHFKGAICGEGPYDLISTIQYYINDNGSKSTLPFVIPMIIKGMLVSDPSLSSYSMSDYLSQQFLDTGIESWIDSKTKSVTEMAAAWRAQLNDENGISANGRSYTHEQMAEMFFAHQFYLNFSNVQSVGAKLDKVFTPGFYSYLASNVGNVPASASDAYTAMHRAIAANNSFSGWTPQHKMAFVHSTEDKDVPYENYLSFKNSYPSGENTVYRIANVGVTGDHFMACQMFMAYLYGNDYLTDYQWIADEEDKRPEDLLAQYYSLSLPEGVTATPKVTYKGIVYYAAGSEITLTMDNGRSCILISDDGSSVDLTDSKFIMPKSNVTVSYAPWTGTGTESDPWVISNTDQWNLLAEKVNAGNNFAGKYFRLGGDISVTTMIGTATVSGSDISNIKSFRGTFDGNGHTITVDFTTTENYCGPFRFTNGATVMNLATTGTITTSAKYAGGVVGRVATGGLTLRNVKSDVTITSSFQGAGCHGGLVGYAIYCSVEGCVFAGKLLGSSRQCGGLLGWKSDTGGSSASFVNCLVAPSEVTVHSTDSQNFAAGTTSLVSITNCYYGDTVFSGSQQGIQAIVMDQPSNPGTATDSYNVSGLTVYPIGLYWSFNGKYYCSSSELRILTLHEGTLAGQSRYWATFYCSSENYRLPEGALAFTLRKWEEGSSDYAPHQLYLVGDGSIIPKGVAVIIMADVSAVKDVQNGAGTVDLTRTEETATPVSGVNLLDGRDYDYDIRSFVNKFYVLGKKGDTFGFFRFTGSYIPAGKAYIVY